MYANRFTSPYFCQMAKHDLFIIDFDEFRARVAPYDSFFFQTISKYDVKSCNVWNMAQAAVSFQTVFFLSLSTGAGKLIDIKQIHFHSELFTSHQSLSFYFFFLTAVKRWKYAQIHSHNELVWPVNSCFQ